MDKEERKKYIFAQLRSLPNATQYVEVTKYIENLEQQCKKQKEVNNKAIEYIQNHQLVFKYATLEEIEVWFNQFYINVLDILNEVKNNE